MRGVGDVGGVGGVARDKGGRAPPEGRDAAQARRYARARATHRGHGLSLARDAPGRWREGDAQRGTHRGHGGLRQGRVGAVGRVLTAQRVT